MGDEVQVAYVCDKCDKCKDSPLCGKECQHTLDFRHALYFGPHHFVRLDKTHYMEEMKERRTDV